MNDYADFCDAFHRAFTRDPNRCVNLGVELNLGSLPDPSDSARRSAALGAKRAADEAHDNCDSRR